MKLASLLLIAFSQAFTSVDARKPSDAILLSSVKTLTFRTGKMTTGRRSSPIAQTICVGGSAQKHFQPDTIRCKNAGSSYSSEDVEWTCTASLPVEFKLGSTEVVCEGYDSPEDEYVLKGSCAVEYRLVLTDVGEKKYGVDRGWVFESAKSMVRKTFISYLISSAFWILFIGVVLWMVYSAIFRNRTTGRIPRDWTSYRPGGGGGDDNDGKTLQKKSIHSSGRD